ncbi:ABC-type transporter [Candidatus Moduliflexus flocculans]|uniref:ABC-type transporter n=1 Tax=Candidatus Moduliflexus flocculans TaxID=1499966 RepID=A0A0S6W4T3_9BACT|nr:ABC-type transporter [Candidatus Moduliflexus flocculans]
MQGIMTIFKKELADHFSSYRFVILFALIAMVSLITVYMVGLSITKDLEGIAKPQQVFLMLFTSSGIQFSLVQFVAFFGPLIGLMLGFDSINRERNEGTLSKLLAQPIYRDSVVNGKFLAGVAVIAIMMTSILLVITGLGLVMIGVVPGWEEIWRMFIYLVISIVYVSFWLSVAILFSILFRSVATSALAALAVWILFSFFISLGAGAMANALTPEAESGDPAALLKRLNIQQAISMLSPLELYSDATTTIIDPMRRTTQSFVQVGRMEKLSMERFSGPLPLSQSVLVVLPYIITLIAITVVCFAISYTVFMRQEIRSI